MHKVKSSLVAGLFGIFLGGYGAHDWYLGKKKEAIIHVALAGSSLLVLLIALIAQLIVEANMSAVLLLVRGLPGWVIVIYVLGYLIGIGNSIWGIVEGVLLLVKGDAGLAMEGYTVATHVPGTVPVDPNDTTPVLPNKSSNLPAAGTASDASGTSAPSAATPGASAAAPAPANSSATPDLASAASATAAPANSSATPAGTAPTAPAQPNPFVKLRDSLTPATKKKILLGCAIGGGAILAIVIISIILALVFHVDYGSSYRAAKELKPYIVGLHTGGDCEDVVDYAQSSYIGVKSYSMSVEECKDYIKNNDDLINNLGSTSGVARNDTIKSEFNDFRTAYYEVFPDVYDITSALDLYDAWHTFVVRVDDYSLDDSDATTNKLVETLTSSNNETLREYGRNYLAELTKYRTAYQNYYDNSNAGSAEYSAYSSARKAFNDWVKNNEPDIEDVAPLKFSGITKIYNKFNRLYNSIVEAYENNYDSNSGDCTVYQDTVRCS